MLDETPDHAAIEHYKQEAAAYAVRAVHPGMIVGLGGGTTAAKMILLLADLLRAGTLHDILGVPCSRQVEASARALGIPLTTLDDHPVIDLTIDGADEVDPELNLIKGGGGALLREKIIAQASRREIIIVDETKLSPMLGTRVALPVEVTPFGWRSQAIFLESLGARWKLRVDAAGNPFLTDEQHYILDCRFGPLAAPDDLALQLQSRAGIVGHGLFLGMTQAVVVGGTDGVRELQR